MRLEVLIQWLARECLEARVRLVTVYGMGDLEEETIIFILMRK
jgi:hypothetical protein